VSALERWRAELAGWAIPDEILAAAPESPWGFPTELFRTRAERPPTHPSATTRIALEALGTGGDVLDVGVGGGATSLPLATVATRITGVDESADMLGPGSPLRLVLPASRPAPSRAGGRTRAPTPRRPTSLCAGTSSTT
jgi:SAM-dependent methyltransferase